MNLESNVELAVVAWAENHGWMSRKISYIGRRGCPDRLFAGYGYGIFVEFKAPGQNPEPHQQRELLRLEEAGVPVHVIDNVADGIDVLKVAMANPISPLTFG